MSDPYAAGKRAAARRAVDDLVRAGMAVGIGSGSTIVFAVERLGERAREEEGFSVRCVPTSFQSRQLIEKCEGLVLSDLDRNPVLDVAIDGADEVDERLNCIKGGGGAHTQEKVVAASAKVFALIADERKKQQVLGTEWKAGVPLEVLSLAYVPVMKKIEAMGGKPVLRMAKAKVGPCVTDNGNFIVDADFGKITDPTALNHKLTMIPGIVDTGLFVGMATVAYFGKADGSVEKIEVRSVAGSPFAE